MTKTIRRRKHPWYDFRKLWSYNGTFNMVSGGRGIGKTYGAKKKAIKDALKNGNQFIYLRRYSKELTASKQTFFSDIAHEFPEYDFRVRGNEAVAAHVDTRDDDKRPWIVIGYFVALSTAQSQKGVSFHNVTLIVFDEFIIERGNMIYLPNEADVFTNFYSTVDRYQDKTKVIMLSNSVSIMNPYFIAYDIKPDEESEYIVRASGFIVAHFPDSENFKASIYQTAFGKFIQDTEYAQYAVENKFKDNASQLLALKDSHATYMFSLELKQMTVSVWYDVRTNEYYIQRKLPKQQVLFTLDAANMTEEKTLMLPNDKPLTSLRTAFRHARASFDDARTRNAFTEIFKR